MIGGGAERKNNSKNFRNKTGTEILLTYYGLINKPIVSMYKLEDYIVYWGGGCFVYEEVLNATAL